MALLEEEEEVITRKEALKNCLFYASVVLSALFLGMAFAILVLI